ncbi:MAG: homocysteine S-methyltransferase family protein [Clostridia bacterium]|nr:homocysteine S-methyltransferase family protein [Clostridia bacterium]
MDLLSFIKSNIVILDGAMGTVLQRYGLQPGEKPEKWNLTRPEVITEIHKMYFDAGSNIVNTNTFGLNRFNFSPDEIESISKAAVENARKAAELSAEPQPKYVAFDIGPSGKMLKPAGDVDFEEAVAAFGEMAVYAEKNGADLITLETFTDSYETKAALLGVKENCSLPVFVTNAYGEDDSLFTGASPEAMAAMLEGMGADAIGLNCSFGPEKLLIVFKRIKSVSSVPVIFKPNAGMPEFIDGKTVYNIGPELFADYIGQAAGLGADIVGGCCGTNPDYIRAVKSVLSGRAKNPVEKKYITAVSCNTHTVVFNEYPVIIGERINPTGKKAVKAALLNDDTDYLVSEGLEQIENSADILDVNCGMPEIDEQVKLPALIEKLQSVCDVPLQIDTSDPAAMEAAMRIYNGKPMINSVNGKKEVMDSIFPLIKKYGGVAVALTLDENGIPSTARGRADIAKRIISEAESYGIEKHNLVFDPLCLTVSADSSSGRVTLDAVKIISEELGCKTILGVSNISFGLPAREKINSVFLTMALQNGLSGAIINPKSKVMTDSFFAFPALNGTDKNCLRYIDYVNSAGQDVQVKPAEKEAPSLESAIISGRAELASKITAGIIDNTAAVDIIGKFIIPALNKVGEQFEKKKIFLPQLIMSAEAAKSSFEVIKSASSGNTQEHKYSVILATVKGDIHDIGKNIVKLILENYGYDVIDLGKNVSPDDILDAARQYNARVVGLSALMTTTVPAMKETVELLHSELPCCKVIVGGAVLTDEFARSMGADAYGADAMETVKYCESLLENKE